MPYTQPPVLPDGTAPFRARSRRMRPSQAFTELAGRVAHLTGRPATFTAGLALVVAWMMAGPLFGFSDSWQLVINTGTTIVTFLMVFLLQATQNRDSAALQAKLDELIRTSAAQNQFIGIERLSEEEVEEVRRLCEARARAAAVTAGAAQRRPESCAAETADRATG